MVYITINEAETNFNFSLVKNNLLEENRNLFENEKDALFKRPLI